MRPSMERGKLWKAEIDEDKILRVKIEQEAEMRGNVLPSTFNSNGQGWNRDGVIQGKRTPTGIFFLNRYFRPRCFFRKLNP